MPCYDALVHSFEVQKQRERSEEEVVLELFML